MKRIFRFPGLLIIFTLFISTSMFAQLISTSELEKLLGDKNLRLIDVQKAKKYKSKHIKGAVNYDYHKLTINKKTGVLKSPEELAKIFGDLGVSENNKIVIYDDKTGKGSSRVYTVLKYLGAKDVSILNGQLKKWMAEKRAITGKKSTYPKTTFTPKVNPDIYVDADYVKANLDGSKIFLLDARSKDEYSGKKGKYEPKGHIKNAVHFEYKKVVNKDGTFKTKAEIIKAASEKGISDDRIIVTYCVSNVRASVLYVAFHEIAGWSKVRIYEGSYSDFVTKYPDLTTK